MYILITENEQIVYPDINGLLLNDLKSASGFFMFESIEDSFEYLKLAFGKTLKKITSFKKENATYIIKIEWVYDWDRKVEWCRAIKLTTWKNK